MLIFVRIDLQEGLGVARRLSSVLFHSGDRHHWCILKLGNNNSLHLLQKFPFSHSDVLIQVWRYQGGPVILSNIFHPVNYYLSFTVIGAEDINAKFQNSQSSLPYVLYPPSSVICLLTSVLCPLCT